MLALIPWLPWSRCCSVPAYPYLPLLKPRCVGCFLVQQGVCCHPVGSECQHPSAPAGAYVLTLPWLPVLAAHLAGVSGKELSHLPPATEEKLCTTAAGEAPVALSTSH